MLRNGEVIRSVLLVVQAHNNLSEERSEFLINDRLSFMRFLDWVSVTGFPMPARSGRSGSGW